MTTERQKAAILKALLLGGLLSLTAMVLVAGGIPKHPHYLHARTLIREARLLVEVQDSPEVHDHLHHAREYMDHAIRAIDDAAVISHEDINDNPKVDKTLDRPGRLHHAVQLLRYARQDLGQESNGDGDLPWRNLAYSDIDKAINSCKAAAQALGVTIAPSW
jgi:hypothetical protein